MPYGPSHSDVPICSYKLVRQFCQPVLIHALFNSLQNHTSFSSYRVIPRISLLVGLILSSLTFSTSSYAALSATTANTIEGTKPYLVASHVTDITSGNDFALLGLDVDGNEYFSDNDVKTKLVAVGVTSIGSLTPTTLLAKLGSSTTPTTKAAYKTPTVVTDVMDDDGDGTFSLTGNAVIDGWYYKTGATETKLVGANLNTSFCSLSVAGKQPYLKISGPVTLTTRYGVPNSEVYNTTNASSPIAGTQNPVRRFNLTGGGMSCFARPNPALGTGTSAGASEWDETNGFKPDISPAGNFPTTGFNGGTFDLIIAGVDVSQLTWSPVTEGTGTGAVTATINKYPTGSVNEKTRVKITLTGPAPQAPTSDPTNPLALNATAPAFSGSKANPLEFLIEGKNGSGATVVDYRFNLSQWFIPRRQGATPIGINSQTAWCHGLSPSANYRLARINELTNAQGITGSAIAIPPSPYPSVYNVNIYQRRLGGGVLAEWGNDSHFSTSTAYWTSDAFSPTVQFAVYSYGGRVANNVTSYNLNFGICVSTP